MERLVERRDAIGEVWPGFWEEPGSSQERLSSTDPIIAAIDQRQERREGTAQFVGLGGARAAGGATPVLRDSLVTLL